MNHSEEDQIAKKFLERATKEDLEKHRQLCAERSNKIDSFRGLIFKAELAFVSISTPLFLGQDISGIPRLCFGLAICFSLIAIVSLVALMCKEPRQIGEVIASFVAYVLTVGNRGDFCASGSEKWYEQIAERWWHVFVVLSLLSMLVAILFRSGVLCS